MTNRPLETKVAPVSASPGFFSTGMLSPVMADSSTEPEPSVTMPSTGMDAPVFSIISGALAAIFTQMLPGLAMFDVLLSSTTVSELIGAMDGFHISKKFSVPVSVMFRFFPTIREESRMIRDALRLRGVGGLEHPLEMLEYRMVPLLTELMQVGNELSASAMTRGLDTPGKRSNVCPMGFRVQDIAVFLLCVAVVSLFIFAKVTGR